MAQRSVTCVLRGYAWLRGYVYDFIELFAPQLKRDAVQAVLGSAA